MCCSEHVFLEHFCEEKKGTLSLVFADNDLSLSLVFLLPLPPAPRTMLKSFLQNKISFGCTKAC